MSDQTAAEQVIVPVKVPQPAEGAPPTLAEPASGAVAEVGSVADAHSAVAPSEPAPPTDSNTTANGKFSNTRHVS